MKYRYDNIEIFKGFIPCKKVFIESFPFMEHCFQKCLDQKTYTYTLIPLIFAHLDARKLKRARNSTTAR